MDEFSTKYGINVVLCSFIAYKLEAWKPKKNKRGKKKQFWVESLHTFAVASPSLEHVLLNAHVSPRTVGDVFDWKRSGKKQFVI